MRLLEVRLLFDGLLHDLGQLQAVDFVGEGSTCNETTIMDLVTALLMAAK